MEIKILLKRIDSHLDRLYAEGRIKAPKREDFFREILHCHPQAWKNWYSRGVRKIYILVVDLLDENLNLKK